MTETDTPVTLSSLLRGIAGLLPRLPSVLRGFHILMHTDKTTRRSIGSLLETIARRYPDAPAVMDEHTRWSYREFNARANRYAALMKSAGVGSGAIVGVILENRPDLLAVVAATVKLGAVAAVYNTSQRGESLLHSLRVKRPAQVFVGAEMTAAVDEIRDAIPLPAGGNWWWLADETGGGAPENYRDATALSAACSEANPEDTAGVRLADPCFLVFTSGTTGLPKASIMTHYRWFKSVGAFAHGALALHPGEVLYCPLPFYHNTALTVGWSCALARGAALAVRRKFSAREFWPDIRRYRACACVYIGEMLRYLCNQPERSDDRDHPLRQMIGNGLRPDIWQRFKQRFDIARIFEIYGASEGNIGFINLFNQDATLGFCPAPHALIRCDPDSGSPWRDADGFARRVAPGEVGLLVGEVSERYPFDGYSESDANETKLLRSLFRPGDCWFNTGDLVRKIGYGHAQFVDRLGDTFRWRGENVSTTEVEAVVHGLPGIAECAVYGVTLPHCEGRAGMLALAPVERFGDAERDRLAERLFASLPDYAVPLFLRIRPELSITTTFKHRKNQLKHEGFQPDRVADPLFFLPPGERRYRCFDADAYHRLLAGEFRY